jgi:DNA polymerase-3 subunit gamma/tau
MRRYAWILLSQNAHVKDVGGNVITIGLVNAGARDSFTKSGADEILHQALIDELGVDWRVEAIIDAGTDQAPARTSTMTEPPVATAPEPDDGADDARAARSNGVQAAKGAIRTTRPAPTAGSTRQVTDEPNEGVTDIADDDDVIHELSSHELLTRELGAKVIEDIRHDSA